MKVLKWILLWLKVYLIKLDIFLINSILLTLWCFLAHIGPKKNWLSCLFMKKKKEIIFFYKKTTKLVFLWLNMDQNIIKVLNNQNIAVYYLSYEDTCIYVWNIAIKLIIYDIIVQCINYHINDHLYQTVHVYWNKLKFTEYLSKQHNFYLHRNFTFILFYYEILWKYLIFISRFY